MGLRFIHSGASLVFQNRAGSNQLNLFVIGAFITILTSVTATILVGFL